MNNNDESIDLIVDTMARYMNGNVGICNHDDGFYVNALLPQCMNFKILDPYIMSISKHGSLYSIHTQLNDFTCESERLQDILYEISGVSEMIHEYVSGVLNPLISKECSRLSLVK